MKQGFPIAMPGQRIGILGGSFDPAHEGHAHVTREAMRRFGLDRIWWLVSPGNPLKPNGPAQMTLRLEQARRIMPDPRVEITGIEARLDTRYTADTIAALRAIYPAVRFVWLMGADNLCQFDRWDHWRDIARSVPIGVLARPGWQMAVRQARAARILARQRVPAALSRGLPMMPAPAWCFVSIPLSDLSSSAIRAQGGWRAG